MILTITLNPLLELRLNYPSVNYGGVNRGGSLTYAAGGKGINVSRQLKYLSLDSLAFTTASGANGKRFSECVERDNLKSIFYKTSAETRVSAVINSGEDQTNYFSANSPLTANERNGITEKLTKILPTVDTIVICGSVPDEESSEIIRQTLRKATELDKIVILDTYGEQFQSYFEIPPLVVHNNLSEIRTGFRLELKSEEEIVEFLGVLHLKGVKQIFLTDGGNPFYASNYGFIYRVIPPSVKEVSSTGCGDAFTAGVIYSLEHHFKFEECLRFATALGAVEATKHDVCTNLLSDVTALIEKVKIEPVGRRMNEFDVPRAN